MALSGQFDTAIKKLTDLTRAGKVEWEKTAAADTFLTIVGKSVVTVGVRRDFATDHVPVSFVRIHDAGKAEAEVSATRDDAEDWNRISTLLDLARESATSQSNRVVSDLLSTLEAIR